MMCYTSWKNIRTSQIMRMSR